MTEVFESNAAANASTAQHLRESLGLKEVLIYARIDSTNAQAIRSLKAGQACPFLVLGRQQTAGKGRRGRVWESPAGAGLYYSLVLELPGEARDLAALSLVTAISVQAALRELGVRGLNLKWPNDILSDGRKLSGILLESQFRSGTQYLVIGIGVNLNLPEQLKANLERPATDLTALGAHAVDPDQLALTISRYLIENVYRFMESGFAVFQSEWNSLDAYMGQPIEVELGDSVVTGEMQGVNELGELCLLTDQGQEVVRGGEVFPSVRPSLTIGANP